LDFGPEVIGCIGQYIGDELWREYRKKTKYYGVVFKVPVNEIIFDGVGSIETQEDKARYLVKYSLLTLHGCYFHCPFSTNNPIIRLQDDSNAKVDHCILLKKGEKQNERSGSFFGQYIKTLNRKRSIF
jgi:hypothetical protein